MKPSPSHTRSVRIAESDYRRLRVEAAARLVSLQEILSEIIQKGFDALARKAK